MEPQTQAAIEMQILGALCGTFRSCKQSLEVLRALENHVFMEPEYRVIFESLRILVPRGPVTPASLTVHLNNRGFPDLDVEAYFQAGAANMESALEQARLLCKSSAANRERGFSGLGATILLASVAVIVSLIVFAHPLRRALREELMQSVTSSHYQILCPPRAMMQSAMRKFATDREPLFTALDQKLGDVASNAEIKIVFDSQFDPSRAPGAARDYTVESMTIRTRLQGSAPKLDPAADAEALLHAAWGKPGNPVIAYWTAKWLVDGGNGEQLGMAAADVDRNGGHKRVSDLLNPPFDKQLSPQDRATLGAAWINEIAELTGPVQIEKLYKAKIKELGVPEVTAALGTTPVELERKWQMWIYAYIAGMPSGVHSMNMPMNMPMSK